jgi:prepilin-type N-terminal cleavage/methylation domain-containing protein
MKNPNRKTGRLRTRGGFTLIELLLVIAILAILSTLGLAVMAGAEENALASRTRAQIQRLSQVLNQQIEEYAYRIIPIRPANVTLQESRWIRDAAIEEMFRVEFPTRQTDLLDTVGNPFPVNTTINPTPYDWTTFPEPQQLFRHRSRLSMPSDGSGLNGWTVNNEGAECLYAILAGLTLEDGNSGLSLVAANEIGDTDGDGRREILDAFGDPLLVDLVNKELIRDDGSWVDPMVDPHIDPAFDPTAMPVPVLPFTASKYQLFMTSRNTATRL